MTEPKDNSSLPLLFAITAAVAIVGVGGWFYLGLESGDTDATRDAADLSSFMNPVSGSRVAPSSESAGTFAADDVDGPEPIDVSEVEVSLTKARLAADADILLFPAKQSAFYYYGQVLDAEPGHPLATAELAAVLARLEQTVTADLAREDYEAAYRIASVVATREPEHALVVATQQALDGRTERLVEQAIAAAQGGDDDRARQLVAAAAALPGRNPDYFTAVNESVTEIRNVRLAAEEDRNRRAQLAAAEAKEAWVDGVRNAIAAGQLIAPAGASAVDLLAEDNDWDAEREELREELLAAMRETARARIDTQEFDQAEALLLAAAELGGTPEQLDELRAFLEAAYIDYESNRLVDASDLVLVKTVPPRYPPRAIQANQVGWVELQFIVTPDGDTTDIEVMRAEPESFFEDAAIRAVSRWKFEPVTFRGQLISQRVGTRLVFQLE